MNCPGCNHSNWEYSDVSIARCKNCGYLIDPYVFGLKSSTSSSNSGRSENSKRLAKIALGATVIMYVISLWISDWSGIWIIGATAGVILYLDHVIYL
jgi:hypothetical protein